MGSAIGTIALMIGAMLLVLRKGPLGAGFILVVMALALYGVTFASELWKLIHGKNVRGRDRNA